MNCKELGYKVGDEFILEKKHFRFNKGDKLRLASDDGDICPSFIRVYDEIEEYVSLDKIKPLEKTMNIKEAYKVMAQNCGIKVGDTVKVLRGWDSSQEDGSSGFNSSVARCIGREGEVSSITEDYGFNVEFSDCDYYFPFFVLEKIKDGVEPIELEDYTVQFKEGGTIEVGCQTIDFETIKKIYDRAKSTL